MEKNTAQKTDDNNNSSGDSTQTPNKSETNLLNLQE